MTRGARTPLSVIMAGGGILVLLGLVLVAAGIAGYRDWDEARRLIAFGLGAVLSVAMTSWLALIWRQQVLGRPQVDVGRDGLKVGPDTIPWSEVDDIAPFSVFGMPHVALVQPVGAPRRLRGLGRVHYQTRGGRRYVFLAERQLGQDVDSGAARMRMAWRLDRVASTADADSDTDRETTGEHAHA